MVECKECRGKLQIKRSYNKAFNDDTPNSITEVYTIQEIACLNKNCSEFGVVVDEMRHKLELEV